MPRDACERNFLDKFQAKPSPAELSARRPGNRLPGYLISAAWHLQGSTCFVASRGLLDHVAEYYCCMCLCRTTYDDDDGLGRGGGGGGGASITAMRHSFTTMMARRASP